VLLHEVRVSFLIKLAVLALQFPVYELFDDITQWLNKIGTGKAKDYAQRLVTEIVENYVFIPTPYKMFDYVMPLSQHSLEFSGFFIVYSIKEEALNPVLACIFGTWFSESFDKLMLIISQNTQLSIDFCAEKFERLLIYDLRNGFDDESHNRFHFVVTSMILNWRKYFPANLPSLSLFSEISQTSATELGRERGFENLQNLLSSNLIQPIK